MAETPSKVKPIEFEAIDGYAYYGTNVSIIDEMPMAHITDNRNRAGLVKSILKTMTCLDFTPIDFIYGWSPKSEEALSPNNGTRLPRANFTYSAKYSGYTSIFQSQTIPSDCMGSFSTDWALILTLVIIISKKTDNSFSIVIGKFASTKIGKIE